MIPLVGDPSLHLKYSRNGLQGLLGTYADDCMLAGDQRLQKGTEKMLIKFDSRPREWGDVMFLGTTIQTLQNPHVRSFQLREPELTNKLTLIPEDTTSEKFRCARALVAWPAHTRADLCCQINRAAQVHRETFCKTHIKGHNTAKIYAKKTEGMYLKYMALERKSSHLRVYADTSFATNDDNSSHLSYFVLLCDIHKLCHILTDVSRNLFVLFVQSWLENCMHFRTGLVPHSFSNMTWNPFTTRKYLSLCLRIQIKCLM